MEISRGAGDGAAPAVQSGAPEQGTSRAGPAVARDQSLVKRWRPGRVPDSVSGKASSFEPRARGTGGRPGPVAPMAKGPGGPAPGSYPSAEDVRRIAANRNAGARNLDITQAYHD